MAERPEGAARKLPAELARLLHDLRGPLNSAVMHLEVLKRTVSKRPDRVRVVPSGVDVSVFCRRDDNGKVRAELGISPTTPIIGSVGRLEPIKGYEVMVEAYAALRRTWSGDVPVLVIGGDGSERASLEARAKAAGVAVPALIMDGGESYPFMHVTALALAKAMPNAQHRTLEGQTHEVAAGAIGPVLVEFFEA